MEVVEMAAARQEVKNGKVEEGPRLVIRYMNTECLYQAKRIFEHNRYLLEEANRGMEMEVGEMVAAPEEVEKGKVDEGCASSIGGQTDEHCVHQADIGNGIQI
ncbi:hypothetical protein Trydic_g3564 [Trypoxylus dichotomus]